MEEKAEAVEKAKEEAERLRAEAMEKAKEEAERWNVRKAEIRMESERRRAQEAEARKEAAQREEQEAAERARRVAEYRPPSPLRPETPMCARCHRRLNARERCDDDSHNWYPREQRIVLYRDILAGTPKIPEAEI